MEQNFDSRLLDHLVKNKLHALWLEWSTMVVSCCNPGRIRSSGAHILRMDGTTLCNHSVHNLFKETLDDHLLSGSIEACHERAHKTSGSHASEEVGSLHNHDLHAFTSSCNCSAHSGRATSYNKDFRLILLSNVLCIDNSL